MAENGKLEAKITVPAGGWDLDCTDTTGGPTTVTLPAGEYYHSSVGSLTEDLPDALATAMNAVMADVWSVSVSAGASGTGKYTISNASTTCTVDFTDTELRDLLGFTGNLSASTSYVSTNAAEALWLPSYGWQKKNGGIGGARLVSDQQIAINSSGNVFSVMGRSYKESMLTWPMETRAKVHTENEVTTNESFETFLVDGIHGTAPWGSSTGPVRFHPDESTDGEYGTYHVLGLETWESSEVTEHYAGGHWAVVLPRLILVTT